MMMNQMNQAGLLHWIDMVSFAVTDINLYLDSHPDDMEAIKYFNHYADLRRTALSAYAEKYGPLTIDNANPECFWNWATEPWPWEGGNC
jgi:spore coat protein JB